MGDTSFIAQPQALPRSDYLACITNMSHGSRTSAAPDYPELTTPYSAVSSFNFPTRADSSLLTPISSSASPPMHPDNKFAGRYPPPPDHSHTQDGAPSANSKMYSWTNHFDMNGQATQTSSPMAPAATVAQDYLTTAYLSDDRRSTPAPPEPYTGMYGVSEAPDHHGIQHQGTPYYMSMPPVDHTGPLMVREAPSMLEADRDPSRTHMPNTPMLSQVHPPNLRSERRLNGGGAHFPGESEGPRPGERNPRIRQGHPRVRKPKHTLRRNKGSQSRNTPTAPDPGEDHKNCLGHEEPPRLKETCPAEERCIFESRWRNRHKKGQDMWDTIQADFQEKFNKTHGKEMLQMKFKRARSKYYVWLSEDEEILRQAFVELEKERYETLLDKFLDMGGSRNMQLNPGDIEAKVVNDLKLEEGFYMDDYSDLGVRRRRKLNPRKRAAARGDDGDTAAPNDEAAVPMAQHSNGVSEDEVIDQVHKRRDLGWNGGSTVSPEIMEIQMEMKMEPGLVPEHVAHQQREAQRLRSSHYGQQQKGVWERNRA